MLPQNFQKVGLLLITEARSPAAQRMLQSILEYFQRGKKKRQIKGTGDRRRQKNWDKNDSEADRKRDRKAGQEGKQNHKETKKNLFLVDRRHCGGYLVEGRRQMPQAPTAGGTNSLCPKCFPILID